MGVYEMEGKPRWMMNMTTRTVRSWDPKRMPIRIHCTKKVLFRRRGKEGRIFDVLENVHDKKSH